MDNVERFVYDVLKDRVGLKNAVKWLYQKAFSTLPGPRTETSLELNERPGAFFGFHDKSPWSSDGTLLLGHTFTGEGTGEQWKEGKPVGITVFAGSNWMEGTTVARTRAWNWQQGAQLQWLGTDQQIVFNDFRAGTCLGVVHDLETGDERLLEHPVAAVAPEGSRYASICFERFGRAMPAYGYAFGSTEASSTLSACELVIRDVHGGGEYDISLEDLSTQLTPSQEAEGFDFFSHCQFSPNGDRLLFLRRQSVPSRRLRSEMFCVDLEERRIQRMQFENMVSHFTWLSNQEALAYANTKDEGDGFYVADPATGAVSNCTSRFNDRDGHPHATPDGELVVFDTYPDRSRYQRLFLWKEGAEASRLLAMLYSPMKFWGASRVDLHPRLRSDGQYVCFDAGFNGIRSLVTAMIPEDV